MDRRAFVAERVHRYYWDHDYNCASTTLRILGEWLDFEINEHVLDAAIGMHGAGAFGAQCGLVEGALMFLGLVGAARGVKEQDIIDACYEFARQFEARFGSLLCRELRPQGFCADNPPHLCEPLSCEAILADMAFVEWFLQDNHSE